MTADSTPWEPPLAGTEAEHLVGTIERLRTTFRWKADGLDLGGLTRRIGGSDLTLGSLLKHLALVEDDTFMIKLDGVWPGEPWLQLGIASADDTSAFGFDTTDMTAEELYDLWDGAVRRSRATLSARLADVEALNQPVHLSDDDGNHPSLRRLLFDLIEEYGRHTGHADLLREAIDGVVGEDPEPGWRAASGDSPVGCR
jgi:hypothetical protein